MKRLLASAMLLCAPPALAAGPEKPKKAEVIKLIKAADADLKEVTDVLADLGGGRFPVLYFTRGKDCISRDIEGEKEENCSPTTSPNVAVVARDAAGKLSLEKKVALPLEAAPWDQPNQPLGWGITFVKDYDGDGKPELAILYGYDGAMAWAVGSIHYRELAVVNLDNLSLAFHVVLDQMPEASTFEHIETKWKFVPPAGGAGAQDLVLDRTVSQEDESAKEHAKKEKIVYKYDPKADKWTK